VACEALFNAKWPFKQFQFNTVMVMLVYLRKCRIYFITYIKYIAGIAKFGEIGFLQSGADLIKLYFFANEDFFRFSLVSLRVYHIKKKIIGRKMT